MKIRRSLFPILVCIVCVILSGATSLIHAVEPSPAETSAPETRGPIHQAKITVLSTMLTDRKGIGEWGFSALVESDGKRVLYDTGGRPDTVLINARELGIDLASVEDVILSHDHPDHTTGLVTLRRELMKINPNALCRAHVARGIFLERVLPPGAGTIALPMSKIKADYEALGGTFIEYDSPKELFAGAWLSGPVPRTYPEKNWVPGVKIRETAGGPLKDDTIPEDQALVLDTDQGLVVLTGCGHAGVINILEYARKSVRAAPIHALIGGLHLYDAQHDTLEWTAGKLKEFGLAQFLGAHCTGIEPVYVFRDRLGLARKACEVGTVGSTFELGKGIKTGAIAQ